MQVLVVEDDPLIRFGLVSLVEEWGYEVLEAGSADEAITTITSNAGIALVITDVDMPGSMDGLKLSHFVRERWPPIQMIVVSGKAPIGGDRLPSGVAFFSKPVRDSDLKATASRLLNARSGA